MNSFGKLVVDRVNAGEVFDIHTFRAAVDNNIPEKDVTSEQRLRAKLANYKDMYCCESDPTKLLEETN